MEFPVQVLVAVQVLAEALEAGAHLLVGITTGIGFTKAQRAAVITSTAMGIKHMLIGVNVIANG